MVILTHEQIAALDEAECKHALKKLTRTYAIEKPITSQTWAQVDVIANTLLWLEDRIKSLDISEKLSKANDARWGRVAE
jgi:hypothetical protein